MTGIGGRSIELNRTAHKTDLRTRTKTMRFHPFVSTGNAPRKGTRGVPAELDEAIPLKTIKYNEQRDAETGFGYFGARNMDHELMTMWLSVDPLADKYPSISPYAYCSWNPVKLVDPDGREVFPTESAAAKVRANAVDMFGKSRVGEIYNKGDEKHPLQR